MCLCMCVCMSVSVFMYVCVCACVCVSVSTGHRATHLPELFVGVRARPVGVGGARTGGS